MKKVLHTLFTAMTGMRSSSLSASFKKGVLMVLTSFAMSVAVLGHTVDSYTSSCTGTNYNIVPSVSSVNNTSFYHWQYLSGGVWSCLVNGTNVVNGVTFSATGVTAANTVNPPTLTLTYLSASLDGVIFRLIISDGIDPCNPGGATVYNGGTSSTNFTTCNSACAIGNPPPPNGCTSCLLGYPDNSNLPKSAVVFNEDGVLKAIEPSPLSCGILEAGFIKAWYSDEHALLLGVSSVVVKRPNGSSYTTNYPITAYSGTPNCSSSLQLGTTISTGAQSGNDVAVTSDPYGGRPVYPALFITDLTVNGATSRLGDWQQGGTPYYPTVVCGSWKSAVKNVDSTHNPVAVTINPVSDPAQNHWNLAGGDAPPSGTQDEGFGAEIKWDIATLGLIPGHTYRIQLMVHDGDQNKTGGDAGSQCTTIYVPITLNPDINVTYVNVPVPGNVSTNDKVPAGTTYGTSPTLISSPAGSTATITMNSNGTYSFVANTVGVYVYKVPVCVPGQSAPCPTSLLTITVLGSNITTNPPVANTDIASTRLNTPVTLKTLTNDRAGNPGGSLNPASVTVTVAPMHGTATVNSSTGDITYTPVTGFTGQDTLTYRVCDNSTPTALCATALQIITVKTSDALNSTLAADDYAFTSFNTPVSGNAKTNDSDPEGNTQTVTTQTTTVAGKGTLVLAADGTFTFTPVPGFSGPVSFPYTTCDNGTPQACASATIYIVVQPAPDIYPDFNVTYVNVQVPGNVNTNDKVPAGTTYGTSPVLTSSPAGSVATIVMNSNGTYTFTGNTIGVYTYNVPVCVPGQSAPCPNSLLTITVLGTYNQNPPVANTDIASTKVNVPVTLKTLSNDRAGYPGGSLNPASVTVIVVPLHGTTSVNASNGDIMYTPSAGYVGMDTLTYRVCDSSGPSPLCATAKQIISIKSSSAVNTTLAADDYNSTLINTPATGNVKTNDTDPEGNTQIVNTQNTTVAGKGSLVLAADGSYTFTPVNGYTGPVSFPYTTCDNGTPQACAGATLYIMVTPPLPSIYPDFNVTYVNVAVPGNVSTNDKVPAGTTYGTSPVLTSSPAGSVATITMNSNGTYSFTANTVGVYTYNVPVCVPGQSAPCPPSLLTITVLCSSCLNNPPVANTDIASTKVNTPVNIISLVNDKPGNQGGTLNTASVTITVPPHHGTTSVDAGTGNNLYTPAAGYVGNDTLTYSVCESPSGLCATAIQIIKIGTSNPVNTTLAADDDYTTPINTAVSGNAKTNDTDPEGNTQTITAQNTTIAGKGTLILNSDGTFTFTPVAGFTGPVSFPYTTTDNGTPVATASATIYIIVTPIIAVPDFTPSNDIDALSFPVNNLTRDLVVNISEILNNPSIGQVQFNVRKLSAFTITYNPTATTANVFGGETVNNSDWIFTENTFFITCTLKPGKVIGGFGLSPVGFTITRNAGVPINTTQNITVTIITNSGGDSNSANNQAVTSITAN